MSASNQVAVLGTKASEVEVVARAPRRNQSWGARHPDPQHRADDLIDQGIRLHGISTWRTDRQDFESCIKQIKALAFKRCPVPFSTP
jgi:hypothetical protein